MSVTSECRKLTVVENIKFVHEVQKHEILYNHKLPHSTNRDLKNAAWKEVSKAVNISAALCKEKWRNLRTTFNRHFMSRGKKSSYYLMDAMQFTVPFIRPSKRISTNVQKLLNDDTSLNVFQDCSEECDSDNDNNKDDQQSSFSHDQPSSPPAPEQPLYHPVSLVKIERIEEREEQDLSLPASYSQNITLKQKAEIDAIGTVAAYFTAKKARLDTNGTAQHSSANERRDSLRMFLLSLLPELTEMTDAQVKVFKRRVLGLIDEVAQME